MKTIDVGAPLLNFYLLHYKQLQYLPTTLSEAAGFDPALVAFEVRDDGSPPSAQGELRQMLAAHPGLRATLFDKNKGVLGMLEQCLADSKAVYTYIGAGDDAVCPAIINAILGQLRPDETPFIVSDFYILDEKSGASVFSETIIPRDCKTRSKVSGEEFRQLVQNYRLPTYLATHAVLCTTEQLIAAGGYLPGLGWHSDWFGFTVAALRSEVRYSPLPMACWRHASGTYSNVGMHSKSEIEILQRLFLTLLQPQYADVRDQVMSPHLCPVVENTSLKVLRAIITDPRLWRFAQFGHFRQALFELLAPQVRRSGFLGKLIRWTDFDPICFLFPRFRAYLISTILRLTGATVGRGVRFGKKLRISQPGGLDIGDGVVFGSDVSIGAPYPVVIGPSVVVGDAVRLESENVSANSPVRFIRRKSVILGEGCTIGTGSRVGPGAAIAAGRKVPAHSIIEDVEDRPLYYANKDGQICIDHDVLQNYYGVREYQEKKT